MHPRTLTDAKVLVTALQRLGWTVAVAGGCAIDVPSPGVPFCPVDRWSQARQRRATSTRQRELAAPDRLAVYARQKARRRQYRFIRTNWRLVLLLFGAVALLPAPFLLLMPSAAARAFALGVLTTGGIWAVWWFTVLLTGTASASAGTLGEQWSLSELNKLRRSGWRVINHVMLRYHDLDHVAVGPGGVLVVESKWTSEPWRLNSQRLSAAAARVRDDVRDIQGMIQRQIGRGKVSGCVFLWGAGLEGEDELVELSGIHVATGQRISDVLDQHSRAAVLTTDEVDVVWRVIEEQVKKREAADAARTEAPLPGIYDLWWNAASAFFGLLAALIAPAWLHRLTSNTLVLLGVSVFIGYAGWSARRLRLLRWAPRAAVAGAAFWILIIVATYLLALTPLL